MNVYGRELYIQERQRQFLMEAELHRISEAARRAAESAPLTPGRPRLSVITSLRRFVQIAWTW